MLTGLKGRSTVCEFVQPLPASVSLLPRRKRGGGAWCAVVVVVMMASGLGEGILVSFVRVYMAKFCRKLFHLVSFTSH